MRPDGIICAATATARFGNARPRYWLPQAGTVRNGTAIPRAATFARLTADQQRDVIASLEKDKHPFFFMLRGATVTGMFANPEYGGNANKAGWKLIGFDDRFSWAAPFGWYDSHA